MKRGHLILIASVVAFVAAMLLKKTLAEVSYSEAFKITLMGFLTLSIFSFLYKDNAFYKFAEHLFVGVSAAYWMCVGFWSNIVQQVVPRISTNLSDFFEIAFLGYELHYYIPIFFGLILLTRLTPTSWRIAWMSKWTLAFIVGATAGLVLPVNLRTNFLIQINSTLVPLFPDWQGFGYFISNFDFSYNGPFIKTISNWVTIFGVLGGLVYFFFSKEHKGVFGHASRFGIWILMLTFGASFGYTVMGRISLLVGRLTFIFRDWAGIIS